MSTFDYNHSDLSDSLSGKEESELIDIIRRHRKIVDQIDDMMIDLLVGAEMCSKVIMENLNNTKTKAIQLINYALCTLMDDMESVDRIENKKDRASELARRLLDLTGAAMPANGPVNVPLFKPAPMNVPAQSLTNAPVPDATVTNTTAGGALKNLFGKMMGLHVVDATNTIAEPSSSGD
ncbi:hypothetical protein LCGC14_0820770 [marine sediment metagenome]|uniref:Uncharacterized protein n=1 Tax=marine sediment metagenome TaxID=412755 RepID=A0A0F9Q486_9ZZZZ